MLALFMPPVEVVVLSSAMAFTLSLLSVRSFSSVISLGEIKPLLLMSAAGTVLGVFILKLIPAELFQLCVGVAVLIASMGLYGFGDPSVFACAGVVLVGGFVVRFDER